MLNVDEDDLKPAVEYATNSFISQPINDDISDGSIERLKCSNIISFEPP